MNQYVTALLLICAALMGQGQAAQLQVRMVQTRPGHELNQQRSVQPALSAQLGMLRAVTLHSLLRVASQAAFCSQEVVATPQAQRLPASHSGEQPGRASSRLAAPIRAP